MAKAAIVTGANQGLGFALAKGLAEQLAREDVVYVTGRDAERVRTAASTLALDARAKVVPELLDVRDDAAVAGMAGTLRERHGGLDVVISNAAARIGPGVEPADQVEPFVATNHLGTTRMLRAFVPALREDGRMLVVASDFGTLRNLPEPLHARFDGGARTLDDVDAVMVAYADAVRAGRAADEGWPEWINISSKVGQVAAMRVAAREHPDRFIAAVCPGLVATEASRPWFQDMSGAQTPDQAAAPILRLVLEPVEPRFRGELVQFGRVLPWR